jgi:hypothetical protein
MDYPRTEMSELLEITNCRSRGNGCFDVVLKCLKRNSQIGLQPLRVLKESKTYYISRIVSNSVPPLVSKSI